MLFRVHFLVQVSNKHFLQKKYPYQEKRCLQFFLDILTSQCRNKVTYPFSAYLRLESGVL